jgi:hypothetical protein
MFLHSSDSITRSNIKKVKIVPDKDKNIVLNWEERIINNYKKLNSMTRGQCIVR